MTVMDENDFEMVKYAGLGVAMGNGVDSLKEVADYVTDTNINSGVANVINKFILTTNTATREALIDYSKKSYIVSNDDAGVEDAIKFAVKNYKQKNNQYNQYVYKNDRIIEKIEKMIEENKKHPDRISKII